MRVTVKDLTVKVPAQEKGATKTLLDALSFTVNPKEVVALMGPSGAGKTTLLNRLVGKGIAGEVTGSITCDGATVAEARSVIGYVTQDDIMYESLTARENLAFTAKFLRCKDTAEQRETAVNDIMAKLRLVKCADTVVGTPGLVKGISGGERKRVNVAMSLLGDPALLLLDEPTSGLDAKMADELMADVSQVAAKGCTVIATIHQPSDAVFQRFAKVLLMESGKIAYYGLVQGLPAKLTGLGFTMPERTPLPEILLDILEIPQEEQERKAQDAKLQALRDSVDAPGQLEVEGSTSQAAVNTTGARLNFCAQLAVLTSRNLTHVKRSKPLTLVRLMQTILSTILVAWIFAQLDRDLSGLRGRMFALFLLAFGGFMFAILGVVNTFPSERAVFLRETQNQWYSPAAFYVSKVIIDTFMQSIFPVVSTLISYWLVGLNSESFSRVLWFYICLNLLCQGGSAMGFVPSALVADVSTALSIVPGLVMPQLLLSGLFLPATSLPIPFVYMSYMSVARYGLQALLVNEFICEQKDCIGTPQDRLVNGDACDDSKCDYCCSAEDVAITGGICPVVTCDDAFKFLLPEYEDMWPQGDSMEGTFWYNMLALGGLVVFFRVVGLVMLYVAKSRAEKSG